MHQQRFGVKLQVKCPVAKPQTHVTEPTTHMLIIEPKQETFEAKSGFKVDNESHTSDYEIKKAAVIEP